MLVKCDFRYPQKWGSSAALRDGSVQKFVCFLAALVFSATALSLAGPVKNEDAILPSGLMLSVDGQRVLEMDAGPVRVPSSNSKVQLSVDPATNLPDIHGPRIQYRLREVDSDWREKQGRMTVGIRFLGANRDLLKPVFVEPKGKSAGWNGTPETSAFTPNQLRVTVPQGAAFASVFLNSSGPPASVGTLIVKGLRLLASEAQHSQTLIQSPESEGPAGGLGSRLGDWHQAGLDSSMASRLDLSWLSPTIAAFQIRDDSPAAHCEWVSSRADIAFLKTGTDLVLTWEEMYDIALSEPLSLTYTDLAPGLYHLDLKATDAFGFPTPFRQSVAFIIPPPFWAKLWFWAFVASSAIATLFGIRNRLIRNRFQRELAAANEARLIETERMRIARDIHDDLGARLTQISLISAYTQNDPSTDARQSLTQIALMAKDLVTALHETLWTVNPENDHLDAVSDFVCQLTQTLCEAAGIRYRVHAEFLSPGRSITSSLRHHIVLAVKEAVNNAIKHGAASQLTLRIGLVENALAISVCDNGHGFDPKRVKHGQGLKNMNHRMEAIHGRFQITTIETGGTQINFFIPLPT